MSLAHEPPPPTPHHHFPPSGSQTHTQALHHTNQIKHWAQKQRSARNAALSSRKRALASAIRQREDACRRGFSLNSAGGVMIFLYGREREEKYRFRHFASGEVRLTFAAARHQSKLRGRGGQKRVGGGCLYCESPTELLICFPGWSVQKNEIDVWFN